MSKSRGKPDKSSLVASSTGADISMAEISILLEEHRNVLAADFKSSFESLTSTLDTLHNKVTDHGQRISSLEDNANDMDHRIQQLKTACSAMRRDNEYLRTKVEDVEGRSRRQNIRIIGLPENIEGNHPSTFFSQLLVHVFGSSVLASLPELDWVLRSLAPKPAPGGWPRPVIIRFHRLQIKGRVICEARKRGELLYNGHKIRLYDDYSPDVLKQRAEYKTLPTWIQAGSSLSCQATLPNGEKAFLMSVAEALSLFKICRWITVQATELCIQCLECKCPFRCVYLAALMSVMFFCLISRSD